MIAQEAYEFIASEFKKLKTRGKAANWRVFDEECPKQAPTTSGIYLMRLRKNAGRLKGSSDVYYIGQSKNLRGRLKAHWKGTNYKYATPIVNKLYQANKVEVAWIETDLKSAKRAEVNCLAEYFADHLELPPGNASIQNWEKYIRHRRIKSF